MSFLRSILIPGLLIAAIGPLVATHAAAQTDSIPGPPLPFVGRVIIGPPDGPACAGDPILVRFAGVFPNTCFHLGGIDLLVPTGGPFPQPPYVNIFVREDCDMGCAEVLTRWQSEVLLPPLPPGSYELNVIVSRNVCPDTTGADSTLGRAKFPFRVAQCDPDRPCLKADWGETDAAWCHARMGPDHRAAVTFNVATPVALAGLEGRFAVRPEGLKISNLEPIGPAAGMHLAWERNRDGASFILFSKTGEPIPACSLISDTSRIGRCPVPVLRLTFEPVGDHVPLVTYVTAGGLLGSDGKGRGVPQCNILSLVPIEARICAEAGCDINTDGHKDVRDLVLMARCLSGADSNATPGRCTVPDCNLDHERNLDDLFCCAREMLQSSACRDCPPDTSAPRPAPNVRVALGEARVDGDKVVLPFWVEGGVDVGAAMITLSYPADRYDAVVNLPASSGWLRLQETAAGEARVGLIRFDSYQGIEVGSLAQTLGLTLKPGARHGGSISVKRVEFSGIEGERLDANPDRPSVSLEPPPPLALAAPRPNPSSGATTISLTLSIEAETAVEVYDLSGRRVATVHRGTLAAGVHDLTWNGRGDGSITLGAGIYFVRATAAGVTESRRIVVL